MARLSKLKMLGANLDFLGANRVFAHFWSKCLGANSEFCGARNLLQRYRWTTLYGVLYENE